MLLRRQQFSFFLFSSLESIIIEKYNDKYQYPKCERKLRIPTTLKHHIKKHNGVFEWISKRKRQDSEVESADDESLH